MVQENIVKQPPFIVSKVRDYAIMMKPNLSFMIAFSSIIGYLMAPGVVFEWDAVLFLFIGGMLVTNGSNIINQILERVSDREMKRTASRPLPTGRMGIQEAWFITAISAIGGVMILWMYFNPMTGIIAFVSLLLYGFAYTPMKKVGSIATFIGAIPGALPPLIGWCAATGTVFEVTDSMGWILFAVQFFWQFPHFWAIAWVGYEEYLKAGIMLLPSKEGKTSFTGLQCMFYSLPLLPIVVFPYLSNVVNLYGTLFAVGFGIFYTIMSINFYLKNDRKSAKSLMYSSFLYLPGVLMSLVLGKI